MEHFIFERNGSLISYWIHGPQVDEPLVVMTHGVSLDHRMFDAQVKFLMNEGYRILTWNMRGHGSSAPMGGKFSLRIVTDDLLAILDERDEDRVVLIGHSFGGYVSQNIALQQPKRVAALVVIGSTDIREAPRLQERVAYRLLPLILRLIPDRQLRRQYANQMAVTEAGREYAWQATGWLTHAEFITGYAAATQVLLAGTGEETANHITMPFLLTHGDADVVGGGAVERSARRWSQQEPECWYQVIPRAGHIANFDNAEEFNTILGNFLRSAGLMT